MSDQTGGMTPQQMFYAMALMGNQGGGQQGTGAWGGLSNAASPMLRAMMLNRMMNAGASVPQQMTGYAPSMQPGQSGVGGFVAPLGPSSQGYSGSGAGAIGGNTGMFTPTTAGAIAPAAAGGGIGATPSVSSLTNPYGSYGTGGGSYPYGIGSSVPNY